MKALVGNVNFFGVTDLVSFSEGQLIQGRVTAEKFGFGDRDSGLTYRPINYNAAADEFQNWVDVGRWDTEGDWQLCDEYLTDELVGPLEACAYPVVYSTLDGKRPKDRPPVKTLTMNIGLRYLFIVLAALGLLFCTLLISYFVYHRESNLVKASQVFYISLTVSENNFSAIILCTTSFLMQPPMMLMVLLGEFCIAIRVLFSSFPVGQEAWTCHGKIW
jgi:hypothetical protein